MNVYCFDIHGFKPSNKLTFRFVLHYHAMTFQLSRITKAGYELNE